MQNVLRMKSACIAHVDHMIKYSKNLKMIVMMAYATCADSCTGIFFYVKYILVAKTN